MYILRVAQTILGDVTIYHQDAWVSSWQNFRVFCWKSLQTDCRHSNWYELCPTSRRHLSVLIRSGFHTVFALNGKETVNISVQSHLQVHRWCIVHKQPRNRKLSGSDVSCWTWDEGHHREHHFCFLPRLTTVNWEGWSTSHLHLRQTRWFQFPHHKLTFRSWVVIFRLRGLWRFYLSTHTISPGVPLVWMFHSEGKATFSKLLKQGYLLERLKSSFRKFYGRYGYLH